MREKDMTSVSHHREHREKDESVFGFIPLCSLW